MQTDLNHRLYEMQLAHYAHQQRKARLNLKTKNPASPAEF